MTIAGVDIVAVSTVVASIAAVLAIIISIVVTVRQESQGRDLDKNQQIFQTKLTNQQQDFEEKLAARQEKLARELAARQDVQQRRRDVLKECRALRECLDEWYRTLRENLDPNLHPGQILNNITSLEKHKHFLQDYSTHIGIIGAAHEPLCDPLLKAAEVFHDSALEKKGRIRMQMAANPDLNRLYSYAQRSKGAGKEDEAIKAYVEKLLQELQNVYFGADEELGMVIAQLSEQLSQTP
jgi:hypothetical protein